RERAEVVPPDRGRTPGSQRLHHRRGAAGAAAPRAGGDGSRGGRSQDRHPALGDRLGRKKPRRRAASVAFKGAASFQAALDAYFLRAFLAALLRPFALAAFFLPLATF